MKYLLSFLFFTLIFNSFHAQTLDATLIELNFLDDSNPKHLTAFQNGIYFTANDGINGFELWYSDGTPEGTHMVRDIIPGGGSSDPNSLFVVDGMLYFSANGELWKSDGTEAGTTMVKNINPNGWSLRTDTRFVPMNGAIYFTANDGVNGFELWKSDGTEAGTVMVKDIYPTGDGDPTDLFVFNGNLYFTASTQELGRELWRTDGTEEGTAMFMDLYPQQYYTGVNSGNEFLILDNYFYFFANDGTTGFELWKSDGTENGTTLVKDIKPGSQSSAQYLNGSILNDMIYFRANDGIHGLEIWKTDGTEEGTSLVKDIHENNSQVAGFDSRFIFTFNNAVYFLANDGSHGTELWKTDGSFNGTTMIKDINVGNGSSEIDKIHVDSANNKLLFYAWSGAIRTLWVSDGSESGTFELSKIGGQTEDRFATINGHTILSGANDTYGSELWITDGTKQGTSIFADLNHRKSSIPSKFTNVSGGLFFKANNDQLYYSDGTVSGTQLLKDVYIDDPSDMRAIDGTLFFSASDGLYGYELWKSDGTTDGTVMVKDINPDSQSSMRNRNSFSKQPFTVIDNTLYFYADNGVHGFELWRSDGTDQGTYMIKDLNPGGSSSYPRGFVTLNNKIYFIAADYSGTSLWTTDGTESGTSKIVSINAMAILRSVNDKLIIVAETSGTTYGPHDLWVSDGTASGTSHLMSFGDNIDSDIKFTTILNDEMYFVAHKPNTSHKSIYKTDGTIDNTVLVYDGSTHPTITDVNIEHILPCGNYVYFGVQKSNGSDEELWRTNGTITEQVAGPDSPDFFYFRGYTNFNGNLLYLADSFAKRIWLINDHLETPKALDVNVLNGRNFEDSDQIMSIGVTDKQVYFSANNAISGYELYVTEIDNSILGGSALSVGDYGNSADQQIPLINLFPNPSSSHMTIRSLREAMIESIELWDLTGRKIHEESNKNPGNEFMLGTSRLKDGIYFARIRLSNGQTVTSKFIVNH